MRISEKINKALFGWLPVEIQDSIGKLRRYSVVGQKGEGYPVVMRVDGTTFHGGLADRWKGIVSLYALSKVLHRDFRIYYTYPFQLTEFQVPNLYDWRISDSQISRNLFNTKMLRLAGDPTLMRVQSLPERKQIHAYANRDWLDIINRTYGTSFRWGELFNQLFKPSEALQQALAEYGEYTSKPYIAVAFRMQNLLGDYPEYEYEPASPERQKEIIATCLSFLDNLHEKEKMPVLVTSDSIRMSQEAGRLPFVFSTKGEAAHADTVSNRSKEVYMKSFVDFYMLAGAEKIYAPATSEMYRSDFPRYAALVSDKEFARVDL